MYRDSSLVPQTPFNRLCQLDTYVFRQFFCPGCGTLLVTDVQAVRRGDPRRVPAVRLARARKGRREMTVQWHSETVGSLLRPPELVDARRRHAAGELGAPEFKQIEDAAVQAAVGLQEKAGLDVIADGELRRESWISPFAEGFTGLDRSAGVAMPWRDDSGERCRCATRRPVVVDRLQRRQSPITPEEWVFLRGQTTRAAKVTMPGAEMAAAMYDDELSRRRLPDPRRLPRARRGAAPLGGVGAGPARLPLHPARLPAVRRADRPGEPGDVPAARQRSGRADRRRASRWTTRSSTASPA